MSGPKHQITVGELIVTEEPCVLATTLGSCVAVCLFTGQGVGGMIHFALPEAPTEYDEGDVFRYGDQALPELVAEVCARADVAAADLSAKIVGGASVDGEAAINRAAGPGNVRYARAYLASVGITVTGEAVGGHRGRMVEFHPATGRLRVADLGEAARAQPARRRRVLIVDDSKTIRDLLNRVLSEDPDLEIVGQAADPIEAEKLLDAAKPDVITLDIHMPNMTGVEWLERLLPRQAVPVVMISSLQMQEGNEVFRSLELGAVDYVQKPTLAELPEIGPLIREKVKAAAGARVILPAPKHARAAINADQIDPRAVLCIGASTGGTEAIKAVLCAMPDRIPATLIVQHIPPVFSKTFADRLNELCAFEVKEAEDGDELRPNRVLVAPGGKQMRVEKSPAGHRVRVTEDAPVNRHRPSVDYLFDSVAGVLAHKGVAVILTGMGGDGAKGLLRLRQAGWRTIGQDENSCVVYGMPRVAFEIGAVEKVVTLGSIAREIFGALAVRRSA